MKVLLDTHLLLWTLIEPHKLSTKAKFILENPHSIFYYSTVSVWEVAIKHAKNKLNMSISGALFIQYCEQAGFKKLELDDRHVIALETLRLKENTTEHKDPFDKILLSQAKADGLTFVTHDDKFSIFDEPNVYLV
ncbi:MAG: type II toxin-antitoxin system VapC family toxin [Spirochaetales bacterium]|nr:type II toxin-antitoxin system VapC family toxin [Spirochaetales bacterium]